MVVYEVYPKKKKRNFILDTWERMSVTKKIISVNVFCYILFTILMLFGVLPIEYIAIQPANIWQGKYLWTFLSSMFMHGGFFHLFLNMLSLFFIGNLLEKILGQKRFFWFYIISGLFAGLLFVLSPLVVPGDLNSFAVGASGALFGLIGVLILLTPNLPVYVMFIPIPIKMKYAAPGMLVLLWLISIGAGLPIGNIAHLGGLLAGVFYGLYLRKTFPNKVRFIQNHFR